MRVSPFGNSLLWGVQRELFPLAGLGAEPHYKSIGDTILSARKQAE